MEILKNLEKYIDNLKQIRALSSPSLNGIFDETGYSRQLSENFVRIGHLAEENRDILVTHKSPVKGVIDLVQCADGLDAASDSVGRSYNRERHMMSTSKKSVRAAEAAMHPGFTSFFQGLR